MTLSDDRVRRLANAGCSARGIAAETGLSRRQVDRVLATMADDLGAEPAPPDLEPPPAPPAAPDLTPKERDRAATAGRIAESKARLEAESARDNLRGIAHLRSMGGLPGQRTASAPIVDTAEARLRAQYHSRASGRDYSPFQEALRSARWRRPI